MSKPIVKISFFVTGILILCISMLALIGYILHLKYLTSWGQDHEMALPTCVVFIAIGIQFIYISITNKNHE